MVSASDSGRARDQGQRFHPRDTGKGSPEAKERLQQRRSSLEGWGAGRPRPGAGRTLRPATLLLHERRGGGAGQRLRKVDRFGAAVPGKTLPGKAGGSGGQANAG